MPGTEPRNARPEIITSERQRAIRQWMENTLGVTSITDLISNNAPWLRCQHALHDPVRSIMAKAHILPSSEGTGSRRETLKTQISDDSSVISVIDPYENAGTQGVFSALSTQDDILMRLRQGNITHALQLGSINYFSTIQLDQSLAKSANTQGISLHVLDICDSVPAHLRYLKEKGLLDTHNIISAIQGDATSLPFTNRSMNFIYDDIVGAYLPNPDQMYKEAFRVLGSKGLYVTRERQYMNYENFNQTRRGNAPIPELISFLTQIFPEESTDDNRQDLRNFLLRHFEAEWDFSAFWSRPIENYLSYATDAGFKIVGKPVIVTPDESQERRTMTVLLEKPE